MFSTYPHITEYTDATLQAAAKASNTTPDKYRIGTLKRADCEISALLKSKENDLIVETRDVLCSLLNQIRIAIGED